MEPRDFPIYQIVQFSLKHVTLKLNPICKTYLKQWRCSQTHLRFFVCFNFGFEISVPFKTSLSVDYSYLAKLSHGQTNVDLQIIKNSIKRFFFFFFLLYRWRPAERNWKKILDLKLKHIFSNDSLALNLPWKLMAVSNQRGIDETSGETNTFFSSTSTLILRENSSRLVNVVLCAKSNVSCCST